MIGVLAVDKPTRLTSHDVVSSVRRAIGGERVGHTGTLDPLATGLLLLCIGRATKWASLLECQTKEYLAEVLLGVSTTTGDADGEVLETCDSPLPAAEEVVRACRGFEGEIEQVPPMYSALKVGGKRLYSLARQGITIPRTPRRVTISRMEVVSYDAPCIRLRVACSKGTYIRVLAADLGTALGSAAHLGALRRTRIGEISVDDALLLDDILRLVAEDGIADRLLGADDLQNRGIGGLRVVA